MPRTQLPEYSSLVRWTVQDVINWLVQVGFNDCTRIFREAGVDGNKLVNLTDTELRSIKCPNKRIKDLVKLVNEVEQPPQPPPSSNRGFMIRQPPAPVGKDYHAPAQQVQQIDEDSGSDVGWDDDDFDDDSAVMCPKEADGMANSIDPDQTAPSEEVFSQSTLFPQTLVAVDKIKGSDKLNAIYCDRKVTEDAQAAISLIQMSQEDQQKSATSHERKDRILSQLFENRYETLSKINLFRGLLERFHGFVKIFQSEKPLIHTLHREMFNITREVLGMFIKPEHIPESVREVLKLDVSNECLQKSDKELQVGRYAFVSMNKARLEKKNQHWVRSLYTDLRAGYIAAAKKLLKMPLGNQTLRKLSVLDPHLANHNQASSSIKALAMSFPNVIDENEAGALAVEADKYSTDMQVSELATSYDENQMRIDVHYWAKVFSLKTFNEPRYPMLQKFISAMLSIFSGPLIESTFNIMDDIVEKDRSKLTVENYEAMAIIKTALKRKKISAVEMTINADMKKACIKAYSTYQQFLAKKKEVKEQKREEKLKDSVMLLKKEKAKKVAKLVKLKNRRLQDESLKRKKQNVAEDGKSRWKRIKML